MATVWLTDVLKIVNIEYTKAPLERFKSVFKKGKVRDDQLLAVLDPSCDGFSIFW